MRPESLTADTGNQVVDALERSFPLRRGHDACLTIFPLLMVYSTDDMETPTLSTLLLDWYDGHGRDLPWRTKGGGWADPYHVWLSEIMLQQTTVAAVIPYFEKFLKRWPNVEELANAADEDVMAAWAGLGYYSRARNLLAAARDVVGKYGGQFPEAEVDLRALPGIGPYTAAAISSIAFGRRAVVVDGNVERVMARVGAVQTPLPAAKAELYELADRYTPDKRPGDYAQAVMDLGATICTPRNPACGICPLMQRCAARLGFDPTDFPKKSPKAEKPVRQGVIFWAESEQGVRLTRRPPKGLLGGMLGLPSSRWEVGLNPETAFTDAPFSLDWQVLPGVVRHTFTHFHLDMRVAFAACSHDDGQWARRDEILSLGLPTVMKKAVRHALQGLPDPDFVLRMKCVS